MKRLTENEIKFMKETNVSWTVCNCDEWKRTSCANREEAARVAKEVYHIDLDAMLRKFGDYDGISLEYTATYLFYSFFTKEELEKLTPEEGIEWLKDMRYFFGYRKWDAESIAPFIEEALEIYAGTREFYEEDDDGDIWNRKVE